MPSLNKPIAILIRVNSKLCNNSKDVRLSKEVVCQQLLKRINLEVNTSNTDILIKVVDDIDKPFIVDFENTQNYRWSSENEEFFNKLIARLLARYIKSPSKEITETTKLIEDASKGSLAQLLSGLSKNSFKQSTDDIVVSAKKQYPSLEEHFDAHVKCKALSEELSDQIDGFDFYTTKTSDFFIPERHIVMEQHNYPRVWFTLDTDKRFMRDTALFFESFTKRCYEYAYNGLIYRLCEALQDEVYIADFEGYAGFSATPQGYIEKLKPMVDNFIENSISGDGLLNNQNWIDRFEASVFSIFNEESEKARDVILTKVLVNSIY